MIRLEIVGANGERFEINQLSSVDDTAIVADSAQNLWQLLSEFGRI